jgi:hypothetical protein
LLIERTRFSPYHCEDIFFCHCDPDVKSGEAISDLRSDLNDEEAKDRR